jgi:hypothetical protein
VPKIDRSTPPACLSVQAELYPIVRGQLVYALSKMMQEASQEHYVPTKEECHIEAIWTQMQRESDPIKKQALRNQWFVAQLHYRAQRLPKKRATQF